MLASWMNFLPLFIVKMVARRYGERFTLNTVVVIQATAGVLIAADFELDREKGG